MAGIGFAVDVDAVLVGVCALAIAISPWAWAPAGVVEMAAVPTVVFMVSSDLTEAAAAAVVVAATVVCGRLLDSSSTLVLVAFGSLGAFLGPPDTEQTALLAGSALALAGLDQATAISSLRSAVGRTATSLSAFVLVAAPEAGVGRPESFWGVVVGFAPIIGAATLLVIVGLGYRGPAPEVTRGQWPLVLVTVIVGARLVGRSEPGVAALGALASVVVWLALFLFSGRRAPGRRRPASAV